MDSTRPQQPKPQAAQIPKHDDNDDDYQPESETTLTSDPEDDGFSAEETDVSNASRKRPVKGSFGRWSRQKRRQLVAFTTAQSLVSVSSTSQVAFKMHPLRLESSPRTTLLNKWLTVRDSLSIKEKVVPNSLNTNTAQVMPLNHRPDLPGRKYTFSVKLAPIEVIWDPQTKMTLGGRDHTRTEEKDLIDGYFKVIPTWRIHVWNNALPKDQQKQLRLFPEWSETESLLQKAWRKSEHYYKTRDPNAAIRAHPKKPLEDRYKALRAGGPLDINVCPTEADASWVAAEACSLLNRYPGEIDITNFPEQVPTGFVRYSGLRALIELSSMRVIRKDFDFRTPRAVFRSEDLVSGAYYLTPPVSIFRERGSTCIFYDVLLPVFMSMDNNLGHWRRIRIRDEAFADTDMDTLPEVPAWWGFEPLSPTNEM
jgi:hypothetical protein